MRIGHPTVQKDEGALAIVCMAIGDMDEHNTDRVSDVPPHTKPRKRNLVGRRWGRWVDDWQIGCKIQALNELGRLGRMSGKRAGTCACDP